MTPAEALREAADEMEHGAEFNMTIADRWSPAKQAANNQRISRARALRDRADQLEKAEKQS